jgi:hypothetical protein
MKEKDLLKLKDKVDSAQAREQELKGQKKAILQQLKEDFDCDSVKAAKKEVKGFEKDLKAIDSQIDEKTKAIEEKYIE